MKFKISTSAGKVMITAGMVLVDLMPRDEAMNSQTEISTPRTLNWQFRLRRNNLHSFWFTTMRATNKPENTEGRRPTELDCFPIYSRVQTWRLLLMFIFTVHLKMKLGGTVFENNEGNDDPCSDEMVT